MPKEGLDKFHITDKQKPLGEGFERQVYDDPEHPDRVVGIYREQEESIQEIKGRFYLNKIIHLLFPKNIPDIYLSAKEPNATVRKKVQLGEEHNLIRDNYEDKELTGRYNESAIEAMKKIKKDPKVQELITNILDAGINNIDPSPTNFGYDEEGNAQYIENFSAFFIDKTPTFNVQKLETAIQKLEEQDKDKAINYFKKLRQLIE